MSRVRKHKLLNVSSGDLMARAVSGYHPHEVSFPMCGELFIIVSVHISGSIVCVCGGCHSWARRAGSASA